MENNIQTQEQQANSNIAVDDRELNYWSKEFGIAKEELLAVIKRGGTLAAAVENYVKNLKFAV